MEATSEQLATRVFCLTVAGVAVILAAVVVVNLAL